MGFYDDFGVCLTSFLSLHVSVHGEKQTCQKSWTAKRQDTFARKYNVWKINKMPETYTVCAHKNIFPDFGGVKFAPPPSRLLDSHAYDLICDSPLIQLWQAVRFPSHRVRAEPSCKRHFDVFWSKVYNRGYERHSSRRRFGNLHNGRSHGSLFIPVFRPMTGRQRANADQWRRSAMNTDEPEALRGLWWMAVKRPEIVTKIVDDTVYLAGV